MPTRTSRRSSSTTRFARNPGATAPRLRAASSRPRSRWPTGSLAPDRAPGDSLAQGDVHVTVVEEGVGVAVVGAEAAAGVRRIRDKGKERGHVSRRGSLPDHHHLPGAQLFPRFAKRRRFVIRAGTRSHVRLQRRTAKTRRVAVAASARGDGQLAAISSSPASTPGKFISSPSPTHSGHRSISAISAGPNSAPGDSHGLAGTQDGVVKKTASGKPRAAARIASMPGARRRWRSRGDRSRPRRCRAERPRGRTPAARPARSVWTCASMNDGRSTFPQRRAAPVPAGRSQPRQ